MEVLKKSNLKINRHIKKFTCKNCECVFNADNTEYRTWASNLIALYGVEAECKCPDCGAIVRICKQ